MLFIKELLDEGHTLDTATSKVKARQKMIEQTLSKLKNKE